ncbi:exonuclease domain-containing protein [Algoriphagus halophytocola]|uniref:Exonuclease domain-containing protein n=1 Tax=Algoriphagus halophytocola TaxID=2991499 RepID=A0ABY6MNH0_9BACT|nr:MULTISPECIES: exonuclease domain-containing protein [unclassified Algoriphagus]UZD23754.1 exonuclease domain-containing protein [Algoriphagus sp. TR-M5]WBL45048.1 exonuclease domain-containing protein [Algoriphagus sp. TR-M9]
MEFAIVDIETTGGGPQTGGITEVAVLIHDGENIIEEYQTLINPLQAIPTYITGLTGIDNAMVRDEPTFQQVSEKLWELLDGRIFVAHNVNFDYSFLREAFLNHGLYFKAQKLCTVRLSRKAFPGLRSYSLGRLCESQRIPIEARHRAMGDARATAILFDRIIKQDFQVVNQALKKNKGQAFLPPNFPIYRFKEIPESCGVYYMLDENGKTIYVGKAINIRERFKNHFSGELLPHLKQKLKAEVVDLKWALTGTEFMALLFEALEIKRLWPKYNSALKIPKRMFGLYHYEDNSGYGRLQVSKPNKFFKPLESFFSMEEATAFIKEGIQAYGLCPKLCGLRKVNCGENDPMGCDGACHYSEAPKSYNQRLNAFLIKIKESQKEILIRLNGRKEGELACCVFERGMLSKFGYVSASLSDEEALSELAVVNLLPETYYILRQFIHRLSPEQIMVLDGQRA